MEEQSIKKRRPTPIVAKTFEGLIVFVVAHSDSMQQRHPSGMNKSEMVEQSIDVTFESMKKSVHSNCFSFARIDFGKNVKITFWPEPVSDSAIKNKYPIRIQNGANVADALRTAFHISDAFCDQQTEGGINHFSRIVFFTDGQDDDKVTTMQIIKGCEKTSKILPLFFFLPSESNLKEGYDYVSSLGETEELYRAEQLSFIHSKS